MSDMTPEAEQPRREPVFNLPGILVVLVIVMAAIHGLRDFGLEFRQDAELLREFSFIPARLTAAFDMNAVAQALTSQAKDPVQLQVARYFFGDGSAQAWTLVTYAFLHGDWIHLGLNGLWLIAFGGPVARRLGTLRFLALFVVTAVAGALMHYAVHPVEFVPVVGASASVSGIMAAAIRFIFQPGAPLGPPVWHHPLPPDIAARLPAVSLRGTFKDRRVLQFTLIWFAINFIFGIASVPLGVTTSAVAWEAHAGGFIAGFVLFSLFDRAPIDRSVVEDWYRTRF